MKSNSFSRVMKLKSNEELEGITRHKDNYTNEALQAVIWELEKRNLIVEGEIELNEEIFEEKEIKQVLLKKEFSSKENSFNEFERPTLYSKKAIRGFTIFFSTIFGAVLLMYNLKLMQKPKERIQVLIFSIIYTITVYFLLNFLPRNLITTLVINLIGYGILSEFFWNKNLGKDLIYKKKEITKPLIISLLLTGFLVFLILSPLILKG